MKHSLFSFFFIILPFYFHDNVKDNKKTPDINSSPLGFTSNFHYVKFDILHGYCTQGHPDEQAK